MITSGDVVFHLAAPRVKPSSSSWCTRIQTNVHDDGVRAEAREQKEEKLVVIASTSEVYGKSADVSFREGADLVSAPRSSTAWAYACSKLIDEFLALVVLEGEEAADRDRAALQHRRPATDAAGTAWCCPPSSGRPWPASRLPSSATAPSTRSFTYVADVVDALVKLAQEPRAVGEVFNVGNTEEVTIVALAERVKRMTGSPSAVQFIPYDEAYEAGFEDMPRRVPDISKVRNLIDYEPRLSLDEIVCRVVEYFRKA